MKEKRAEDKKDKPAAAKKKGFGKKGKEEDE